MKKITTQVILIFLFLLNTTFSQNYEKYEYPSLANTPEWKQLSIEERLQMLQIPEDKLNSLPTEVLLQAYIDNPLTGLIFGYNTIQEGFDRIFKEFNGLRYLVKRQDFIPKLIKFYGDMDINGHSTLSESISLGMFTFRFMYIEALLSQYETVNKINFEESKIIINELLKKYEEKIQNVNLHSLVGLRYTAYAIGHLLNNRGVLNSQEALIKFKINNFLDNGNVERNNTDVLEEIIRKAYSYIQN